MNSTEKYILKHLVRYRLAESHKVPASSVVVKESVGYDYLLGGSRYALRFAYPMINDRYRKNPVWDFDFRRFKAAEDLDPDEPFCDYYILVGMENDKPKRLFVVPFDDAPETHVKISIKGTSKYINYEI